MSGPWLTVVTVVKDDPDGLARTADSVAQQDLTGVEFLVIDSSADRAAAEALGSRARVEWREPAGIYPAMNAGLALALGRYVLFLNAGDSFHSPDVLSRLHGVIDSHAPAWVFGPVEVIGVDGTSTITPPWDYFAEKAALFARGHFPPHQGTIAGTDLLRSVGGFDVSYRIAADYASALSMSRVADPLQVEFPIATFREGGTSTVQWKESFAEFHRARQEILRPTGLAAASERLNAGWHFAKVFAYREVILRARR